VRYRQVVVLAARWSRRERDQLRDEDIVARRAQFANVGGSYERPEPLSDASAPMYDVPESGPAKLEYRGLPLDEIEDLLPRSSAYRQAARILFPQPAAIKGRPLTPLHGGHVALCAVSGMLNGIFGSGKDRHVAAWQAVKVLTAPRKRRRMGLLFGSRWRIDVEVFQTITTDCHLKYPAVHQSTALVVLTMIRVLAYALSLIFYQRQICSHVRGRCAGFHEFVKHLAYWFVALSPNTS
jgi:hypothetical protein